GCAIVCRFWPDTPECPAFSSAGAGAYSGRMSLPLSSALASRFEQLPECGSTNSELAARAVQGWPDFSVLLTTNQTAGRGRLDRVWVAPPGQTLAVSVLLRPTVPVDTFSWLPLIAGLAMARAVAEAVPFRVALKWPNDVLVDGLKVSGLLAELLPAADGVVVGAGLNLTIAADGLPTPKSTSLILKGADPDRLLERSLTAYLRELRGLYSAFTEHGGDAEASGIRQQLLKGCGTIGQRVRVELPDGSTEYGHATGIDDIGRLLYQREPDGSLQAVAAGDVTHVRYE
ncbi:MAG: biotin--[acetyl-CoA-carboxylase] ligase, partial [Homoserinimonas sp.]|nr:biotin--[acetyl-CoA-carboxylase] ligase [Homoserinimonas sp.]